MAETTWSAALARCRVPRQLETRARKRPLRVEAVRAALVVTPGTGSARRITRAQFEDSPPLIDGSGRGPLLEASFNSSYIEAITDDLRRG